MEKRKKKQKYYKEEDQDAFLYISELWYFAVCVYTLIVYKDIESVAMPLIFMILTWLFFLKDTNIKYDFIDKKERVLSRGVKTNAVIYKVVLCYKDNSKLPIYKTYIRCDDGREFIIDNLNFNPRKVESNIVEVYIDGEDIIIDNVEFSKTINQDIEFISEINKSAIKENKLARTFYNLVIKPLVLWFVVSVMMLLCLIVATTFIDRSRIGYLVLMATVVIIHIFFYQIYKFLLKNIIL